MAKEKKPTDKGSLQDKISNWSVMLQTFKAATENELWELLKYEVKHKKRLSFAIRLHGFANQTRYDRERKEILAALSK